MAVGKSLYLIFLNNVVNVALEKPNIWKMYFQFNTSNLKTLDINKIVISSVHGVERREGIVTKDRYIYVSD